MRELLVELFLFILMCLDKLPDCVRMVARQLVCFVGLLLRADLDFFDRFHGHFALGGGLVDPTVGYLDSESQR